MQHICGIRIGPPACPAVNQKSVPVGYRFDPIDRRPPAKITNRRRERRYNGPMELVNVPRLLYCRPVWKNGAGGVLSNQ
jgi:hypothetical protein